MHRCGVSTIQNREVVFLPLPPPPPPMHRAQALEMLFITVHSIFFVAVLQLKLLLPPEV